MALVAILLLLFGRLTVLRIRIELTRARRRRSVGRARIRVLIGVTGVFGTGGRVHDLVLSLAGLPAVVGVVCVVIRNAAEPHRRVIRRQHRYEDTNGRPDDNEAPALGAIPRAAVVVVGIMCAVIHRDPPGGQRTHSVATRRISMVHVIARIPVHVLCGKRGPCYETHGHERTQKLKFPIHRLVSGKASTHTVATRLEACAGGAAEVASLTLKLSRLAAVDHYGIGLPGLLIRRSFRRTTKHATEHRTHKRTRARVPRP